MPSLSDKLKSLGVKVGTSELKTPPKKLEFPIEDVVTGDVRTLPAGTVFQVSRTYPGDYQHGIIDLAWGALPAHLATWAQIPNLTEFSPEQFAFVDTETTGLAGGSGTYAFLIGVGRFCGADFALHQYIMRDPLEERAQLQALTEFLDGVEVVVTFNGKSFDVPLLNSRYIANGVASPLPSMQQLDLLHLSRRLWRERLQSCALNQVEREILSVQRGEADVPGWQIPQLYFDYLRSGDARPLKGVIYHNEVDIISLAALLNLQARMLSNPLEVPVVGGIDWLALGKFFEFVTEMDTARLLYEKLLASEIDEGLISDASCRLSFIYKRSGHYSAAVELWQNAAWRREIYAHVELAKYFEHQQRDFRVALKWTETAISVIRNGGLAQRDKLRLLPELTHRQQRLHQKIQRDEESA